MISSELYDNSSLDLKEKIFKILLFLFFSIYTLKQTTFFYNQTFFNIKNFNNFLFLLNLSFIFFRFRYFQEILTRINLRNFLITISSILFSLLIFAPSSLFIIDLIKIFIIFSISLCISRDFPKCIEIISDSISLTVILCIFLSNFISPYELIQNENWIKNSAGFINSNVPSLFLFSAIFGYFLINKKSKFLLVSIVNFLFYFFLKIHSRTATFSIILLICGMLIKNKSFHIAIRYISLIISSLYLILFFSFKSFNDLIGMNFFYNFFDNLLSERISSLLSQDWQINTFGRIINLKNDFTPVIDSLYFELIRYLGLISIFFLFLFFLNRYYFKSKIYMPQFAVSILLISGALEGLFYKITPMILFLTHIILENFLLKTIYLKEGKIINEK